MRTLLLTLAITPLLSAQAPTADTFKQVMNKQLQKLLPTGYTERNVLFQDVRAGAQNGGFYAFKATLLIRDYGVGYPPNRFYGATCVGKLEDEIYQVSRDQFGEWRVQGKMTPSLDTRVCKDNPAAGVSSQPLNTLQGSAAPGGQPAAAPVPAAQTGPLPVGEWACYGTGGRALFSFYMQAGGKYMNGDRQPAGTYNYNQAAATIAFQGGMLGGQVGKQVQGRNFVLSSTVSCEWTGN